MNKKTTITDIASRLGIAPSTVSRAMSGRKGVSDKLRAKIASTAQELNYIPNIAAKSLKTNKTKTVGLVIPDMDNPFFLDVIKGVERVLFPRGYKFIVCSTDENSGKEQIYIEWLLENRVEGVIACPVQERDGNNNLKAYKKIVARGIPVVLYDRLIHGLDELDSVVINNQTAIMEALSNFKAAGHLKVGICLSKKGLYTMEERLNGFKKGVEAFGMETRTEWILEDLYPLEKGEIVLENFFKLHELPDGIITANHPVTAILLKAAKRMRKMIPNDFSLITFDDLLENEFMNPPLTAVKQPVREIGKMAATLLLGRIDGEDSGPVNVTLNCTILKRKSVKELW